MSARLKIVSGGQTGADRAALAFAREHGFALGGWCPKGRLAEDGTIPVEFPLEETPSPDYSERTGWNVRDSDATVIFSLSKNLTGGSLFTAECAQRSGKPWLHLSREIHWEDAPKLLHRFLIRNGVRTLNVAGPRASNEPEVGDWVKEVLEEVLLRKPFSGDSR